MPRICNRLSLAALALGCTALMGCAAVPRAERNPADPWQRMNRATFSFDYQFYRHVAEPVAKTYVRITPSPIRRGIANFFDNLDYPTVIVNDLLQGQLSAFGRDTARLLVDTTFGIGGLMDPATRMGLARDDRDFGQTFGKWGIPTGPYLVLPILGPSDLRDAIGLVPAVFTSPLYYVNNTAATYSTAGVETVNTATEMLPDLKLDQQAFDHYAFARDVYLSRRRFMVEGSRKHKGAEQELQELEQSSGN